MIQGWTVCKVKKTVVDLYTSELQPPQVLGDERQVV